MPQKLSLPDFLKSFEFCPRLAVELLVENPAGQLLLLKRDKDPFAGYWHLPGGFLLKDEPIDDCITRLAEDELNITLDPVSAQRLGIFETLQGDPRGHILHHPVKIKLPSIEGQNYFLPLPSNIIPYQLVFLQKLGYR
ncbi:MAG: NUDIX domain-containing protein [Candidatus Shapirobacteria bacterium]